jgi:hypothetical protein
VTGIVALNADDVAPNGVVGHKKALHGLTRFLRRNSESVRLFFIAQLPTYYHTGFLPICQYFFVFFCEKYQKVSAYYTKYAPFFRRKVLWNAISAPLDLPPGQRKAPAFPQGQQG